MAASATVRVEPDETAPEVLLIAGPCPPCDHAFAHSEPGVPGRAFLSSLSAFGLPDAEQAGRRLTDLVAERARVHRAVRYLRVGSPLTFVTLALIVASVGVVWYGPTA